MRGALQLQERCGCATGQLARSQAGTTWFTARSPLRRAALRLRVCALQPRSGDAATAAVVACDGRVRDGAAPAAPSALLLALPPGAYTVARTLGGTRLVDWDRHVSRLAESLRLLQGDGCAGDALLSGGDDAVRAAVAPSVRAALLGAQAALPCTVGGAPRELLLTMHVALAPAGAGGSRVTAHACALPAPRTAAVAAAVQGPPRALARAKASTWVAERAPLEAARPPDCAETVLSCPRTGALLEGLVSNLFVLCAHPDGGTQLRTAAPSDGVLSGVARAALLRAAASMQPQLRVCEEAPVPPPPGGDADWLEAFTCNAARGVTPLSELRWLPPLGAPPGTPPPRPPLRLARAPGPVTAALAAAMLDGLHGALSPDFAAE